MRLIDADNLKENGTVIAIVNGEKMKVVPVKCIEKVPTVAYPFEKFRTLFCGTCQAYMRIEPERPQGEWIKWNFKTFGAMGDWEYKCSNCEKVYGGEYNFCPNCGADMRDKKNESENEL